MSEAIAQAMDRFEIPEGHEKFMFCLPAFYVAKADGKVSLKEAMSIIWNSMMLGLIKPSGSEKKAFESFAQAKFLQFQGKRNLDDFRILADAINAKLAEYSEEMVLEIRQTIRQTCEKVAAASGPMFREKVLPEEREMLDEIFASI